MRRTLLLPFVFINFTAFCQQLQKDSSKVNELSRVTIVGDKAKSILGSGQYINSKKIEKLNQPNINHVLRVIPGVNIRDEEGFGLRPNIGLRGTPVNRSAKITLMEDGILMAPAPYADPSAYYFPTFARMQGVEVLKGSSQIKYGPYTIGGAVNLLSTSIPESFKGFAQLSYGSFNTNQERLWIGDSRKNIDYVFEVNRLASNGFKKLDNGGNTGFDRRDMMGKLRWHTDKDAKLQQSVTLKFVNTTEKADETYLGLTYEDYKKNSVRRYAATQKDRLDLSHHHITLSHFIMPLKQLTIHTTAYYTNTYRDWARVNTIGGQAINDILNNPLLKDTAYQIMTGTANGNIDHQSAARTYFSKGVQTNAQYYFSTQKIQHKIQFGLRYHSDEADRYATRSTYTMTNGTMILSAAGVKGNQENQVRVGNSLSSYLNYELSYKKLKISPGIRFENIQFNFENYGSADNARLGTNLKTASNKLHIFLPGIGINYDLNQHMNIFGGAHKGFSPPGMPSVTSTTAQAKAETSINYEIGYRIYKNGFIAHATGFINNYNNILGSDNMSSGGMGSGDLFNAGHATIHGLELSAEYNLMLKKDAKNEIRLPFTLAYTYTSAKFEETFVNGGGDWGSGTIKKGDLIPFITPHLLTATIGIENNKLNAILIGRYTGLTRIKPGQSDIIKPAMNNNYGDVNALKSFLILDLSTNYKINKTITLFGTISNILNNKAITANLPQGYRPNMPLSLIAGVKAQF